MSAPRRCRFCDEPLKPDNSGSECDAGCRAGYSLFVAKDEDDEDDVYEYDDRDTLTLLDH